MLRKYKIMRAVLRKHLGAAVPALLTALLAGAAFATAAAAAPCTGPGAPSTTETKCLTAVQIPGNALRSFDISWVNPYRTSYYLADRSNAGVDVINTISNTFSLRLTGFVGIVFNPMTGAVNNNKSGPDGVVSHGIWVYAGDGDSTVKVFNLASPTTLMNGIPTIGWTQSLSTGGSTRVDEMALTTDGTLLLAANNAEDPPYATLFKANGDNGISNVSKIIKISVDQTIIPMNFGLSLEQPAWEPKTARFYTAIPIIANNPAGCNYGQLPSGTGTPCSGGVLVTDPVHPVAVQGAFDPATNTGVVPLTACGPNGATVGPASNVLLGCTPGNYPPGLTTQVIDAISASNATSKNYSQIAGVNGSDEVWFNSGDQRYYTGSSANKAVVGGPAIPVLGVINGTSVLVETIPQGSSSHSVAADCQRNTIYVPQAAPFVSLMMPGDTTGISAGICGSMTGCVAVYIDPVISNTGCGAALTSTDYYNAP